MFKRWLIVDVLIFAVMFSFAAQVCMFSVVSKQNFAGVVYGANGPVVGAAVSASGPEGSGYAITDGSGHYSISEGLRNGNYTVMVMATGYLTNETEDNVQVIVGQAPLSISFDLQLSGGVSGRVTDAVDSTPVANTMVVAYGGGGTYGWAAMTDSDGKYLLATNLATGSYNVTVMFPEGHVSASSAQSVIAGAEVKNVNFALARSGIISGRITTPGGTPLRDITVSAYATDNDYYGYATTNVTGHYRISNGLGTATYTVMAFATGPVFNSTETDAVNVTAGQEESGVDLQLTMTPPSPSGIITGKVTDTNNGNPIGNATVTATGPGGSGSAETDSNGDYAISSGLGTGTYNVTANAPGYLDLKKPSISVTVNVVTPNVNFQLSKVPSEQSGTITGTITGAPDAVPEFQTPIAVALSLTLVAVAAGRLFLRTKRPQQTHNIK